MTEKKQEIVMDLKKLEALLPGKRIVDRDDLGQFWSLLYSLRDEGFRRKLPEDFVQTIFHLEQYFNHYILEERSTPYQPSKEDALRRLHELLPR